MIVLIDESIVRIKSANNSTFINRWFYIDFDIFSHWEKSKKEAFKPVL